MFDQPLAPKFARLAWVFPAVLGILSAFAPMSVDMYLPAMPAMAELLGASSGAVQWTLSAFLLGFGLGQGIYGPLSDRFGRKKVLIGGIVIYSIGSLGCAIAVTVDTLIFWRFIQALGACSGQVLARAMVRDRYDRDRAARMMSLMVLLMGAAPLLAPIIGGQILVYAPWHAIFWVLTGFGVLSVLLVILALGETLPAERRVGFTGMQMVGGFVMVLRNRRFLGYVGTTSLIFAGMFAYISASPFVFITVFGISPQHYGFFFGANVIGLMIGAFINSRIVLRVGSERLLSLGVAAAASVGIALVMISATGWFDIWGVAALLFLYMATISFIGANAMAGGLAIFPQVAGTASAVFGMLQFTAGSVSGAMVGWLFDGSAVPMAVVIGVCALGGFAVNRFAAVATRP